MSPYPARSFGPSRFQIEAEESTDPDTLDVLAQRNSNFVQSAVAANPHTRPETLARLGLSENKWTRQEVARNPNTPIETLQVLVGDPESSVRARVGYNRSAPAALLAVLADDLVVEVRVAAAWNHSTDPVVLARLGADMDTKVRTKVAANPHTPEATLIALTSDSEEPVRRAVTSRGFRDDGPTEQVMVRRFNGRRTEERLVTRRVELGGRYSAEMMRAFVDSDDVKMHFRVAAQPDASEDLLLRLVARTTVVYTLKIVAENRGATARVLAEVADRGDSDACRAVAVHPNTDEATLTRLAMLRAPSVHAALALLRPGGLSWLAAHADPKVRLVAAKQYATVTGARSEEAAAIGARLLDDPDPAVQVAAAVSAPVSRLADLAGHPNPKVRKVVADRTTDPVVLAVLAADEKPVVRRAVARNRWTSAESLGVLAGDSDARTRADAAERFLASLTS